MKKAQERRLLLPYLLQLQRERHLMFKGLEGEMIALNDEATESLDVNLGPSRSSIRRSSISVE